MNGLVVRGLQVSYGDVRVLSDLDLDIRRGEVVGVAGLNGVGKTTLLRALSGVVPRRATLLSVDGVALPSSPRQVARAGVLHVPEGRRVFANLSVIDNLRYGAAAAGRSLAPALRTRVFQTFPRLAELRERRAGLLSGGEQQMLAVARGLVAEPAVLMVDELSHGLFLLRGLGDLCGGAVVARRDGELWSTRPDQMNVPFCWWIRTPHC